MKTLITIVAFRDDQPRSVAYRKFEKEEDAVLFYMKMLAKKDVRVISTRKVRKP